MLLIHNLIYIGRFLKNIFCCFNIILVFLSESDVSTTEYHNSVNEDFYSNGSVLDESDDNEFKLNGSALEESTDEFDEDEEVVEANKAKSNREIKKAVRPTRTVSFNFFFVLI
jgi:hypothetical protein